MYEMLSNKGVKVATVEIIRTTPGEVVNGKELLSHERKVLVRDVYSTTTLNTNDEFFSGAYLRVNKLLFRKLLFRKENPKKKARGHKVHASPTKWTKSKRKMKRNSGQIYVSSSGKLVPAKTTKNVIRSCRFKQYKELSDDARKNEFRKFWTLGDINEQNAYLLLPSKSFDKNVKKALKDGVQCKRKTKSRDYTICNLAMCKEVFKAVYDISNGQLGRLLKLHDENPLQLPKDQRGGKTRVLDLVIVEALTSVLTRMSKYVSHYEQHKNKDENFVYMEPGCTWNKVYDLVKKEKNEFPAKKKNKPKLPSQTWFYEKVKELSPLVKIHLPAIRRQMQHLLHTNYSWAH